MIATLAARKYVQVAFEIPAAMVDDAAAVLVAQGALGCAVGGDHRSAHRHATLELKAYFERLSRPRLATIRRAMAAAGMLARPGSTPPRQLIADPGWATRMDGSFRAAAGGPPPADRSAMELATSLRAG